MRVLHVILIIGGLFSTAPLCAADDRPDNSAPESGTFSGRFVLDSEPAKPGVIPLYGGYESMDLRNPPSRDRFGRVSGVELSFRAYLRQGIRPRTIDHSLQVGSERGIANVIIYAWKLAKPLPERVTQEEAEVVLQIRHGQFEPRVLAITAEQTLQVENLDPLNFGFHLYAVRNRGVNRLIEPESSTTLTFSRHEPVPQRFCSDFQAWASGVLHVHDNSCFAVSAADGSFEITGLPPGPCQFRVWHERVGFVKNWPKGVLRVEVQPGDNRSGDIVLSAESLRR